jgi:hypothetical protein
VDDVAVDAKRILLRYGAPINVLDDVSEVERIELARLIAKTSLPERERQLRQVLADRGYMEPPPVKPRRSRKSAQAAAVPAPAQPPAPAKDVKSAAPLNKSTARPAAPPKTSAKASARPATPVQANGKGASAKPAAKPKPKPKTKTKTKAASRSKARAGRAKSGKKARVGAAKRRLTRTQAGRKK